MKKLFLTVALVGGMLSFAAMNNTISHEKLAETDDSDFCSDSVNEMEEDFGHCFSDQTWTALYNNCMEDMGNGLTMEEKR